MIRDISVGKEVRLYVERKGNIYSISDKGRKKGLQVLLCLYIQRALEGRGKKCEAVHSPPFSDKAENVWSCSSIHF